MLAKGLLRAARTTTATWSSWSGGWWGASKQIAGVTVNEETALNLSTAFACTRVISATGSSLPFKVYKKRPGGGADVVHDHPLSRIIYETYDEFGEQGSLLFRSSGYRRQVNGGNLYAQILWHTDMSLKGLMPIHPDRVTPFLNDNNRLMYEVRTPGSTEYLPAWEMLHIPSINPSSCGLMGVGVIEQAAQSIGIGLAQERHEAAQWQNGARPQIVIKTKKNKWDKGARDRFRDDWNDIHQGPDRAGKVGILEDGADIVSMNISNQDAQFLLLKQHSVEDICRWYGVQPHLVAHLLRSTNNNIEQQSVEFVQYTMLPWLIMWEHFVNIRCLRPEERAQGLYVKHSVDGLLRGDVLSRTKALQIQRMYGAISGDEWREIEERNPLPRGGDEFWRPNNVVVIGGGI